MAPQPEAPLEVIQAQLVFELLVGLLVALARFDRPRQLRQRRRRGVVGDDCIRCPASISEWRLRKNRLGSAPNGAARRRGPWAAPSQGLYGSLTTSTRRFMARPSGEPFEATGLDGPKPAVWRRWASIPSATSLAFRAAARRSERRWLKSAGPTLSVCPSIANVPRIGSVWSGQDDGTTSVDTPAPSTTDWNPRPSSANREGRGAAQAARDGQASASGRL